MMRLSLLVTVMLGTTLSAQQPYTPARYAAGPRPILPVLTVGGGEAFVELTIGPNGAVQKVTPLRSTPPFTQGLIDAVSTWRFSPAMEDAKPVASRILVASLFRAPTLLTPTLGEKTVNIGSASPDIAYPSATKEPPYPPQALSGGVVLVEVNVDGTGAVSAARVVGSSPAFDQAALDAARRWSFRPARIKGRATATSAYLVFGFPQPVTGR